MVRNSIIVITIILTVLATVSAQTENLHYTLAKEYFAKGNYDLAMDAYKKVLTAHPEHYESYLALGDIYRIQRNFAQAELSYQNALRYAANGTDAQKRLADLYEATGRKDEALKTYREALVGANQAQRSDINAKINNLLGREAATTTQTPAPQTASPARAARAPIVPSATAKTLLDSAVFYYQSGVRNGNNEHLNRSLNFITRALRETPGYPAAFYYAGLIRRRFGQNEKARINFERAIDDPEWGFNAHFYLGRIYGDLKQYERAIGNLEIYISKTDFAQGKVEAQNLINTYRRLMEAELAANPPIDIRAVARSEIAEELSVLPPLAPLREIEIRIGRHLTMAIVDSTTNEGQDLLVGVRLFNNREYDRAIDAFRRVIEKYPGRPTAGIAVYNIGVCMFQLRNWEGAVREFANYMNRFPRGALLENAMFLSGVALREQMKNNEAQKIFQDYITRFRNGRWVGKAYEYLGDIFTDLDRLSSAVDAYRQADALGAENDDKLHARYKLGETFRRLQNFAAAERAYLSVISLGEEAKLTTRVPEAYYRLADHYYQNRRWAEAENFYTRATRLFPDYADTPWGLYQIANCLYHTRKYREAIAAYDFLRERFPDAFWAVEAEFRRNDAVWRHQYRQGN